MYRFSSFKRTSSATFPISISKERSFNGRVCCVCHKLHNIHKVLNYSTKRDPAKELQIRKRSVKKIPSYAEILVVTKGSTLQQKAPVKILSLKDLKLFTKTDLNLAELYKLKSLQRGGNIREHTYHNLTVIDHLPIDDVNPIHVELPTSSGIPSVKEEKQPDLECDPLEHLERITNNPLQPEILDDEEQLTHTIDTNVTVAQTANEELVMRTLSAYIEVCNYLKMPQRGLNALIFHRNHAQSNRKVFPPIRNINIYNSVLGGFAAKGSYDKIEEILKYISEEKLDLNVHSYAAIFECLGRINVNDSHLKQIRSHASEALQSGITFDRIVNETIFASDQRDMVLKAMHDHSPNYRVKWYHPHFQYSNELVNELNHSDQLQPPPEYSTKGDTIFIGEDLLKCVKKQIEVEKYGYLTVKSIEKKNVCNETVLYRNIFDDLIKEWEKAALNGFNRDLMSLTARRNILTLEPYLRVIPSKEFVQIIVEEAKKIAQGSETYSPTCQQLYKELGLKVYMRYKVLQKQKMGVLDKILKVHGKYCEHYANLHPNLDVLPKEPNYRNTRQLWQWIDYLNKAEGASVLIHQRPWIPTVLQNIGKFLYHIIMHDLKIDINVMRHNNKHKNYLPSFYTIFRSQGRLVKEEVKPHPILSRLYRASVPETLTFNANEVPMLCPPVPWTSFRSGGYLVSPCEVVRLPTHAILQKQRFREAPSSQLYPSLDCLNQLASVPWTVNGSILDVVIEVFNSGGSTRLDIPELHAPSLLPTGGDKKGIFRQKLQIKRKRAEVYSLWCDCLYRLSLANHFRNHVFWLPHNMDFRGRVYPIPPHLNHLGSDMARSLLVFAEPRPLGPHGFDWLKLHLVNLTGLKKRDNITNRLIFANEIMDKVLDSADYPLTGKMWWAESEEPWQTLACCMEIAKAHRSDNPEEYLSHFPVHQDGSCNGLQHYAALGRDQAGAYSVNLSPSHVPQDVYSAVVSLVEEQRAKDEANGNKVAKILKGFVVRKVIKQTIMTTVYGVTRFGARLQIAKQLKDIENFPKEHVWSASSYLTSCTFDSLRSMFTSTREIQDWFTDCARLISSVCNENVEWVTPLGLPIVQPYNKYRTFGARQLYEPFHMDKYEKPNVMKQRNAFPPNFIHSLDSSHMMLTSLWCERMGIVFVSVHDCFWTHASTVPLMNEICRKQFVALHSQNILENLSQFLTKRFSFNIEQFGDKASVSDMNKLKLNRTLGKLPKTGDFDINEVLQSVYFFS